MKPTPIVPPKKANYVGQSRLQNTFLMFFWYTDVTKGSYGLKRFSFVRITLPGRPKD